MREQDKAGPHMRKPAQLSTYVRNEIERRSRISHRLEMECHAEKGTGSKVCCLQLDESEPGTCHEFDYMVRNQGRSVVTDGKVTAV